MDIENSTTNAELDKMKAMLRGDGLIYERTLCEIQTASELFKIMRQNLFITRDNILWLQAIVKILERPELLERTKEWSRMYGNVVYFREAPEPVNGFSHSKFHVEGKDFTNLTRRSLQRLRSEVANLVCVPERFIFIAGVEPSSSFVVTLMMPEMYVNVLKKILGRTNEIEELNEIGVDSIAINGDMFNVNGVARSEVVATDQQMKFLNVYKQLKTKSKLLEDREIDCLKLSRELESMTVPKLTLQTFKNIFPNVSVTQEDTAAPKQSPASLTSQSALVEFEEALRHVVLNGYDRKLIERLLDSNSSIVNFRVRDNLRIKMQQMVLTIQELDSMIVPLKLEIAKCKFYLQVDVQELERRLLKQLQDLIKSITPTVKVELTQAGMDLLKKVSRWLRFSDRQKLEQKYVWDQKDNLTQALRQDQSLLLACIYYKEIVQTQSELDVVQFVVACLTTIEREDLRKKFLDLVANQQQPPLRKVPQQRSKSVPRPQQPTTPNKDVDLPKLVDQVAGIEKKVSEIHETIQSTKKDFTKGYDSTKSNFNFLDPMSMYAPPSYAQRDTLPSF